MRTLLCLLAVLAGCSSQMTWVKPDSTPRQLNLDSAECYRDAVSRFPEPFSDLPIYGDARDDDRRMRDKTERDRLRQEFREGCLKAKGYSLQPSR